MGHIFISYSHQDKDYVHRLQESLQREGLNVWIDDRIDYGDEWPMVIQDHLDSCDAFILVASESSYKSKWVQKEVARAQRTDKPFFPLLLSGPPWLSIESTQYVNVTSGELPPEKFYEKLARVTPRGERSEHRQAIPKPKVKPAPAIWSKTKHNKVDPKAIGIASVVVIGVVAVLLGISRAFNGIFVPEPATPTNTLLPSPTNSIPITSTVAQTSTPVGPATEITEEGAQMVLIPEGEFLMGSNNGGPEEKPAHTVVLKSFYMDKYKVTNALYNVCAAAKVCKPPKFYNSYLRPTYYGDSRYNQYPVIAVDWYMAKAYCEWRGGRLPTEAEWEKAARGTDGRTYPWGEGIDQSRANYNNNNDSNYVGDTSRADAYPTEVSPYGLYDMAGNTWEWVADLYDPNYYATLLSPVTDPLGPASGDTRVIRGGSWNSSGFNLRTSRRSWNDPTSANVYIGFRCAKNP